MDGVGLSLGLSVLWVIGGVIVFAIPLLLVRWVI